MSNMKTFQISVLLIVYAVAVCEVSAQKVGSVGLGKCPKMREMKNFDLKKFSGKWYEVERSFYMMEIASSCTSMAFQPAESAGDLAVAVKTVNRWTGNPSVSLGKATPLSNGSSTLKYRVSSKLPSALARALPGAGSYTIVDTDYETYAILWSCSNMGLLHADQVWVLGKSRELTVSIRATVYDKLHTLGFDSDRLTASKNENCPDF